ncbi:MAG TPA: aminotransferase class III-fold pyridoxal phosphate-dependent enzyme [Polyangiaceae bacterium]|nr:aminotransferase class III-fold pyridoxal phosphate-dependent enzyme [Polyangiaceae bacterium]
MGASGDAGAKGGGAPAAGPPQMAASQRPAQMAAPQRPAQMAAPQRPPQMVVRPPGPASRAWAQRASAVESPAFDARREARQQASGAEQGPIVYAEARGVNVLDVDGNCYVDLTAGFGAQLLGHGAEGPARALQAQAGRLWQALGDVYPADVKVALLERLAALYPEPGARVLLGQSGADAITAAMKTALLATGRPGVVAFEGSYHGLSYAPLAASGLRASYREPFREQLSGRVRFVPFPRWGGGDAEESLEAVKAALAPGDVGLVLVEPVLGRGGCVPAPKGFLAELVGVARAAGALTAFDEIWTGLGRSGAWLLGPAEGALPDLVCLGKGLGGGLPLSACVGRNGVMAAWAKGPGEVVHTATFHGAPLACATALAVLDEIEAGKLVERSARVGAWLRSWVERCQLPGVRDVRGRGLMVGVELAGAAEALAVSRALLAEGYIVLTGGTRGETLTLTPPLVIDEPLLVGFVEALGRALGQGGGA